MTKIILITGGAHSSLRKTITSAALAPIMEAHGLKVKRLKHNH